MNIKAMLAATDIILWVFVIFYGAEIGLDYPKKYQKILWSMSLITTSILTIITVGLTVK